MRAGFRASPRALPWTIPYRCTLVLTGGDDLIVPAHNSRILAAHLPRPPGSLAVGLVDYGPDGRRPAVPGGTAGRQSEG